MGRQGEGCRSGCVIVRLCGETEKRMTETCLVIVVLHVLVFTGVHCKDGDKNALHHHFSVLLPEVLKHLVT